MNTYLSTNPNALQISHAGMMEPLVSNTACRHDYKVSDASAKGRQTFVAPYDDAMEDMDDGYDGQSSSDSENDCTSSVCATEKSCSLLHGGNMMQYGFNNVYNMPSMYYPTSVLPNMINVPVWQQYACNAYGNWFAVSTPSSVSSFSTPIAPSIQSQQSRQFSPVYTASVDSSAQVFPSTPTESSLNIGNAVMSGIQTELNAATTSYMSEEQHQNYTYEPATLCDQSKLMIASANFQSENVQKTINTQLNMTDNFQTTQDAKALKKQRKEENIAKLNALKNELNVYVPPEFCNVVDHFEHPIVEHTKACRNALIYKGAKCSKDSIVSVARYMLYEMNQDIIAHHDSRNFTDETSYVVSLNFATFETIMVAPYLVCMIRNLCAVSRMTISPSSQNALNFKYKVGDTVVLTRTTEIKHQGRYIELKEGTKYTVVDLTCDAIHQKFKVIIARKKNKQIQYTLTDALLLKKHTKAAQQFQVHLSIDNEATAIQIQRFIIYLVYFRLIDLVNEDGETFADCITGQQGNAKYSYPKIDGMFWTRDADRYEKKGANTVPQFLDSPEHLEMLKKHVLSNNWDKLVEATRVEKYKRYNVSCDHELQFVFNTGKEHCALSVVMKYQAETTVYEASVVVNLTIGAEDDVHNAIFTLQSGFAGYLQVNQADVSASLDSFETMGLDRILHVRLTYATYNYDDAVEKQNHYADFTFCQNLGEAANRFAMSSGINFYIINLSSFMPENINSTNFSYDKYGVELVDGHIMYINESAKELLDKYRMNAEYQMNASYV